MGSSLCLAVRQAYPDTHIAVWARNRDRLKHVEEKAYADSTSIRPDEVAKAADIVILCVPITAMKSLVEDFIEVVPQHCIITDVGSVKSCVEKQLAPLIGKRARWIGSHPMAGSEKSGISAARSDLYNGARTIVTPTDTTDPKTLEDICTFWTALGSSVLPMDPQTHDLAVAGISHLPHLIASALVNATPAATLSVSGAGYRDTTRVAAGSAELWKDILLENREAILQSLQYFIDELGTVRNLIQNEKNESLTDFLNRAAETRDQLSQR
jgi:prephenate dehydrogenase